MKLLITLVSWLAWNAVILRLEKDKYDDAKLPFSIKDFANKYWDNWLVNFFGAILLLVLGENVLHVINVTESTSLTWNDAYYAGSGFFTEAIVFAVKKWKSSKEAK